MANLTDADLDSQLVDLADVPLVELRTLATSELVDALERAYAVAEFTTGNELQEQDDPPSGK
jgi:hypothetical protein